MFRIGSFVLAFLIVFSVALSAQNASQGLRTGWGDPDLQGVWDFRTLTPLERPDEFEGKAFLTEEEAAVFEQQTLEERDMDRRDGAEIPAGLDADVDRAYNQFWWDFGTEISENRRTSLITDPPDGKIPWTPEGIERNAALFAILFGNVPEGPEDRALSERGILGFNSGPPMLPSAYNNNVQLLQTPDPRPLRALCRCCACSRFPEPVVSEFRQWRRFSSPRSPRHPRRTIPRHRSNKLLQQFVAPTSNNTSTLWPATR